MSRLYFRHSPVYEGMLSRLDGMPYSDSDLEAGFAHAAKFAGYWDAHNDRVFAEFQKMGFEFADFWIAYFVRPRDSMIPFSDPLTIFMNDNFDETASVIAHELTHVMLTYPGNEAITNKMMGILNAKFPGVPINVKYEILPALVSRKITTDLFGRNKAETIQLRERKFPVLGDAWKLIDSSPEALAESDPLLALEKLNPAV